MRCDARRAGRNYAASESLGRTGIVVVRCQACDSKHLIADNLGWFGDAVNIEQMLAERGEEVRRILVDDPEALELPSAG